MSRQRQNTTKCQVAIVCDWLTNVGGAERVLLAVHNLFPDAPIYTSQYNQKGIDWFKNADVRTGWMQIFPSSLRRFLGPLRQFYFSHLDLSHYDYVISVTGAEAKSVRTVTKKQRTRRVNHHTAIVTKQPEHHCQHICYCHVPTQYYWQMYNDYIKDPGFGIFNPLARLGLKLFVRPSRRRDYDAAQKVDHFVTISKYAAEQIRRYYGREASIIHPPVNTGKFSTFATEFSTRERNKIEKSQVTSIYNNNTKNGKNQEDKFLQICQKYNINLEKYKFFITTSRQVTWKRIDLCIKACLKTKQQLVIIGEGPEHDNLLRLANNSPLITFCPRMDQEELGLFLSNAKGYLFPSLEPFGIAPVEALASGCPVIAYGEGGALDYIHPDTNGILFSRQSVNSLASAIQEFDKRKFFPRKIVESSLPFDVELFNQKILDTIYGDQA